MAKYSLWWQKYFYRILLVISIIVTVIYTFLYLFIRVYHRQKFNPSKIEQLIVGASKFRSVDADPCDKGFANDPRNFDQRYVKINLYCSLSRRTSNTIVIDTLRDQKLNSAISEVSRINGVPVSIIDGKQIFFGLGNFAHPEMWRCYDEDVLIKDFYLPLIPRHTYTCLFNLVYSDIK